MREQKAIRKVSGEAGEKSRENAAQDEEGQIGEDTRRGCEGERYQKLSDVVGQTADSAGQEGIFLCEKLHRQRHDEHTCKPARQTVGKADELPEQQGGEQDACEQYQKGILQGGMSQDNQSNDVSQSQLHSGNR